MYRILICKLIFSRFKSNFSFIANNSLFILIIVCLCLAPTFAFYEKGDVVELTASNFDRLVIQSDEIWVIEFYAPWYDEYIFFSQYK